MIIHTVGFSKTVQLLKDNGMNEWEKPQMHGSLDEKDNALECLHTLRNTITQFFKETEFEVFSSSYFINNKEHILLGDKMPIDTMILEIEACTELTKDPNKGLLSFELTPKDKAQQAAYDLKKLQLIKK